MPLCKARLPPAREGNAQRCGAKIPRHETQNSKSIPFAVRAYAGRRKTQAEKWKDCADRRLQILRGSDFPENLFALHFGEKELSKELLLRYLFPQVFTDKRQPWSLQRILLELFLRLQHRFELVHPVLVVRNPFVAEHFLRAFYVNLFCVYSKLPKEVIVLYVCHCHTDESRLGRCNIVPKVGKVHASCLYRPVNVPAPRVAVGEYVYWQLSGGKAANKAPAAARCLPLWSNEYAILLFPELVFVQPLPHGVLFHYEDVICVSAYDFHAVVHVRRDHPAAPSLLGAVYDIFTAPELVLEYKRACHHSLPVCVQVQVLALHVQRHFQVLHKRVAF